ncbi:hypothetical protein LTR95_002420 [Oleoguttula sp. CCFEE 5521]
MAHHFAAGFYDALTSAGDNASRWQHVALEFRDFCLALRELAEDTAAGLIELEHLVAESPELFPTADIDAIKEGIVRLRTELGGGCGSNCAANIEECSCSRATRRFTAFCRSYPSLRPYGVEDMHASCMIDPYQI